MNVRKKRYGVSSLEDLRDPHFKVIRRALHENQIGCRPGRCPGSMSVVHNRTASLIVRAIREREALLASYLR